MGVRTGAAGVAAAAPIFLPIINIGILKKNENEKKDEKFVFSCNGFCQIHRCHLRLPLTAIIAGGKGLTVKD